MGSFEMLRNANDIEFDSLRILQEEQQRRIRQAMRLYPAAMLKRHSTKSPAMPHALGRTVLLVSGTALHWMVSTTSKVLGWASTHRVLSRGV